VFTPVTPSIPAKVECASCLSPANRRDDGMMEVSDDDDRSAEERSGTKPSGARSSN